MIVITTEVRDGVTVVHLDGAFRTDEAPALLVQRIEQVDRGGLLLVDLTDAAPIPGSAVSEFLARLEAGPRRSATVLVHEDLEARRALRAMSRSLPVVPDVDQAVSGHFPAALAPRQPRCTQGEAGPVKTARRIALILGLVVLAGAVLAGALVVVLGPRNGVFALVVVAMAVVAIYHRLIHPWHVCWGATRVEAHRHLPGDDLVPAAGGTTRAITIAAAPQQVWPWLVQIGFGRAGWYSYDWIDNDGKPSASTIRAEFQDLVVGDRIPMTPELGFDVVAIDPVRSLVSLSGDGSTSWCLHVEPDGHGGTRLISRFRAVVQAVGGRPCCGAWSPTPAPS